MRPESIFPLVSKPYLAIHKVNDWMTGVPEQIVPAPEHEVTEEAVENNEKELGKKNIEEVKEDTAPQMSENNVADKDR